ncbi:MAG: hypothetical protein B0D92_00405, partial [Spirochaeta sp. LUC14_002_19_P3]
MNKKNASEQIELFQSLMAIPEISDFINRLGITVIDLDKKCFLSKGLWEEISDNDISVWKEKWSSSKYFEGLENKFSGEWKASSCGSDSFLRSVFRIRDKQNIWRSIFEKSGVLFTKEDGSPWIIVSTAEDVAHINAAQELLYTQDKEASILNSTIEVIISSLDIDDTVERILDQAKLIVPYDQATLQVLHDGVLEILGAKGLYELNDYSSLKTPFPEEGSLSTRAIQERRPWQSNNVDPSLLRPYVKDHAIRSWLGVPLIAHGDIVGLLTFDSKEENFFTNRHIQLAASFAGPVAIALENARMHGETYQLAMKDALTGIGSRHAFNLHGKYLFEKSKREERHLALAMLDLDWFKKINDDF